MFGRFTRNVVVPGWILAFGCAAWWAPPMSVAASLSLFMLGVVVIPAVILIPGAAGRVTLFWLSRYSLWSGAARPPRPGA